MISLDLHFLVSLQRPPLGSWACCSWARTEVSEGAVSEEEGQVPSQALWHPNRPWDRMGRSRSRRARLVPCLLQMAVGEVSRELLPALWNE